MLDDIALFVQIAAAGSLNKAAEQLEMPPATVTRWLQRLEHKMGCKLINRSARQFSLTGEGQALLDDCGFLVETLQDRAEAIRSARNPMSGKIKILAPVNLAIDCLQPIWSGFLNKYEDISLELVLNNHMDDFLSSQADFAIRVAPSLEPGLACVKLGAKRTVLVASPEYLRRYGYPKTPDDLNAHTFVVASWWKDCSLYHVQDQRCLHLQPKKIRVTTNELSMIRNLCLSGLGVSLLPVGEDEAEDLRSGRLQRILPDWEGKMREVYLVWGRNARLTQRAQRFIDFIRKAAVDIPVLNA